MTSRALFEGVAHSGNCIRHWWGMRIVQSVFHKGRIYKCGRSRCEPESGLDCAWVNHIEHSRGVGVVGLFRVVSSIYCVGDERNVCLCEYYANCRVITVWVCVCTKIAYASAVHSHVIWATSNVLIRLEEFIFTCVRDWMLAYIAHMSCAICVPQKEQRIYI